MGIIIKSNISDWRLYWLFCSPFPLKWQPILLITEFDLNEGVQLYRYEADESRAISSLSWVRRNGFNSDDLRSSVGIHINGRSLRVFTIFRTAFGTYYQVLSKLLDELSVIMGIFTGCWNPETHSCVRFSRTWFLY